jgi:hypothetical protein
VRGQAEVRHLIAEGVDLDPVDPAHDVPPCWSPRTLNRSDPRSATCPGCSRSLV